MTALVDVQNLNVTFGSGRSAVHAVRGISFTIEAGQSVAIVGESGSGKSVTARSLIGLAGRGSTVRADELRVDGVDARSEHGHRIPRSLDVGHVQGEGPPAPLQ